jgi:hypothetical protein
MSVIMRALIQMVRTVLALLALTFLAFGEPSILRAPSPDGGAFPDFPGMRKAPGPGDTVLPDFPGMRRAPNTTVQIRTWRHRIRMIPEP